MTLHAHPAAWPADAPALRFKNRALRALGGGPGAALAFTEIHVLADCGQPNGPHWRWLILLLLLAQMFAVAALADTQLRAFRAPRPGRPPVTRTIRAHANGVRRQTARAAR